MNNIANENAVLKLDDVTLQTRSQHYPAELREPLMWLGAFTRTECSRDIDLLTSRATDLGIRFDKTTWSKILRGRWNRDANDQPTENPVVALPKLLKAIETLTADSRRKQEAGKVPFVETPTAVSIMDWIDTKRVRDRVCKFGVLVGETGTQKTATCKEYSRRNNHGLVKLIESPATPSLNEFISELAHGYGASRQLNSARKKFKITESVNETRTIIVDNAQRLFDLRRGGSQPVFHYMQKLQEDTGCTIIFSITPDGERDLFHGDYRGFFEQFIGRAGGIRNFHRLPAYPDEEDVQAIAHAFKFNNLDGSTSWVIDCTGKDGKKEQRTETGTILQYLVDIAHEPGRIRRLFEDLQSATIRAEKQKTRLTIAMLKYVRGEE